MSYDPVHFDPGQPPTGPTIPESLNRAVQLMYVGAGLSVLSMIYSVATMSSRQEQVSEQVREQAEQSGVDPEAMLQASQNMMLPVAVLGAVIGAGLWLWMAWKNKQGRSWARVVATVFFGIYTLSVLQSLNSVGVAPVSFGLQLVTWFVGLGALIFMWRSESTDFYQRPKTSGGPGYGGPAGPGGGGVGPPPQQPPQPPQPRQPSG